MATKKAAKGAMKTIEATPEAAKKFLDGYRVIAVQLENVKKIAFARIRPTTNIVLVNGDNESGKTTLLESINWAMGGTSEIPTLPVRKGQKNAKITVDLGELRVTRYFTFVDPATNAKGHGYISRIEVEERSHNDPSRFSMMREPQKVLDALKSKISFDPLAFTLQKPKDQFETLRGLVSLDIDIDELAAKKEVAYSARRDAGRDVDALTARLKGMSEPDAALPTKPVNVQELTAKLQNAANHNSTVEAAKQRKQRHFEDAEQCKQAVITRMGKIEELQAQIETLRTEIGEYEEKSVSALQAYEAAIIPEAIDTAEVAQELQNANATNAAIGRAVQYRATKEELDAAIKTWGEHDRTVKKADEDRAAAIARAKMPVKGLSIGDGEVMFEGLPFEQASNAQQIRISVALGIAANPKLRVMYIQDGSLLGTKMMKVIEEMAEEFNYQIWIERVDTTSKVGIMMEDGEASGDGVELPKK